MDKAGRTTCTHPIWEQEDACVDGKCPICPDHRLIVLAKAVTEMGAALSTMETVSRLHGFSSTARSLKEIIEEMKSAADIAKSVMEGK